jgi:hypothetical protein
LAIASSTIVEQFLISWTVLRVPTLVGSFASFREQPD